MESRHADLKRALDPCPAVGKPRFRIVKLEDRIAPAKDSCHVNPHGKVVGGKCDCYLGCYGGY